MGYKGVHITWTYFPGVIVPTTIVSSIKKTHLLNLPLVVIHECIWPIETDAQIIFITVNLCLESTEVGRIYILIYVQCFSIVI